MKLLNLKLASIAAIIGAITLLAFGINDETPVGSLRGTVTAEENGNPIPAWVSLTRKAGGEQHYYYRGASEKGEFVFTNLEAGTYKLEISSKAHHMRPVRITIEEGRTRRLETELQPNDPYMELAAHQHVFTPSEKPQLTVNGFVDTRTLDVELYRVNLDTFLIASSDSLESLLGLRSHRDPSTNKLIKPIGMTNNPKLTPIDSFQLPITKRDAEGIFVKRIDLSRQSPGLYVISTKANDITRINWLMVTKLGLVTKSAGGNLLAYTVDLKTGNPIPSATVDVYTDSQKSTSGITDASGLVELAIPAQKREVDRTIIARDGDSFAFVNSWFPGVEGSGKIIYAYTERPVYRPGQKVYFRGIMRDTVNEKYKVTANQAVTVEVRDNNDTLVYRETRKTDRFGCYSGNFKLSDDAATGYYSLSTSINNEQIGEGAGFKIAAYRKPEFTAKIKFSKKRYVRGENARATISANYYFGAPLVNAKVNYYIRRSPYWLFAGEDEDYGDGEYYEGDGYEGYGGYGEYIAEGEIETDDQGRAVIEFPAIWPQPKEEDAWDNDQEFTVEATITDRSERSISVDDFVIATRGEFAINVTPENYVVTPDESTTVSILAMDFDNKPVRNKRIDVVTGRSVWSEETEESEFHRLTSRTVTTDSNGRATITVKPRKPGDIDIIAKVRDSRGNTIVGRSNVWAYIGDEYDYGYRYSDLEIIIDKKLYNPGDKAKVLINSDAIGQTALVTVEGERIYDRYTVKLDSKSKMIEIPIKDAYKPNFYIAACYVKNKDFTSDETRARVSLDTEELNISVKPNKKIYKPGETAVFKVKTTDVDKKPVSAELSLGVVDEAIYAIAEDYTDNILDYFYSLRNNSVHTNFSFPEIYLSDPDKAGANFKGVVRKKFEDTAYWKPNIITNSSGEATVRFKLPDNLTTWRITTRGITMNTECGETTDSIITQKDLLVRLEMPRFLVQTDHATISAITHNYTGKPQRIKVELKADGLKLNSDFRQEITVGNNRDERVDWEVDAPKPGDFPITVYATGQKANDAVQLTLPILPHGIRRQSMRIGALGTRDRVQLRIPVRNDAITEVSRLKIRMSPSIASTLLGSLQYLAQYPYGCTEQTTSSFLPDVILWKSMKDLNISMPWLQAKLPDMVSSGLSKLYKFRLEDGGWSWYEYGEADPWMTAYVCYALIQTKRAGFPVNQMILDNGINKLRTFVAKPKLDPYKKVYAAYVLALAGENTAEYLGGVAKRQNINSKTLATISLGFSELNQMDHAKNALDRLFAKAIEEPDFIHWTYQGDWPSEDVETTALALQAVMAVNPDDPRAAKIARWLMSQRQSDYWYSTRDTAMVLYAMTPYLQRTNELAPNYTATLLVNGKIKGTFVFDKASLWEPDQEIIIHGKDLDKGTNYIEITKSGEGNLYYTTDTTQYLAKKNIPAIVNGSDITVNRSYYLPSPRYYDSGSKRDLGSNIHSCEVGDVVLVRLIIHNKHQIDHMMLDDFIPAGFEIVDKGDIDPWEWSYWWVGRDVRDDRVSFYLESLPAGKQAVEYQMRASTRGEYHALPAQLWAMYQPSIRSSTAESGFSVR